VHYEQNKDKGTKSAGLVAAVVHLFTNVFVQAVEKLLSQVMWFRKLLLISAFIFNIKVHYQMGPLTLLEMDG
jgi:hypothetical protein